MPRFISLLLFGLSAYALHAQQPLNLDFERQSVEGIHRPWGWAVYGFAQGTSSVLDSTTVRHGRYSLRMERAQAPTDGARTLGYWIAPRMLRGKSVTVRGWVKANLTAGETRCVLETYGHTGVLASTQATFDANTDGWQSIESTIHIDSAAYTLLLKLDMAGQGQVWFDQFSLAVAGESMDEVPLAPTFTAAQVAELDKYAFALQTVGPSAHAETTLGDLATFEERVTGADIVALGESTHVTGEFFTLKHRLLKFMVEELGTTHFAIEDNQLAAELVNNYVLYGQGTARASMEELLAVWSTEEVLAMIEWMRSYNIAHPERPVQFVGFDMQNPLLPIDSLQAFLQDWSPDLVTEVADRLRSQQTAWQERSYPYPADSIRHYWLEQATFVENTVLDRSPTWYAAAATDAERRRIQWAVQNARVIRQSAHNSLREETFARDRFMAENTVWIMDTLQPQGPLVIWAHDTHINEGAGPDPLYNFNGGEAMGSHLHKKYGAGYRSFGILTYDGSYRAARSYFDLTWVPSEAHPGPDGSFEEVLHRFAERDGVPGYWLDLARPRSYPFDYDWWIEPRPIRFVNYVVSDFGFEQLLSIPFQFDGLLFVDRTGPSHRLTRK